MIPHDKKDRFDELCAGRALGDLSVDEEYELTSLCREFGLSPDTSLDLLAAAIHANALDGKAEPLPADLARRLHQWADRTAAPEVTQENIVRPPRSLWRTIALSPLSGWAAAAAILIFSLLVTREKSQMLPGQAEKQLRAEAPDLIERPFDGLGDFKQAKGSVIWSDALQQGFMKLEGIPANDPHQAQYQLWIVDPARDADSPVDGGVFDIPSGTSSALIPITAKLSLSKPQAFVITMEQPGGVVKSKQEKVVALAKS